MRIIVAGGTGLIGGALIRSLLADRHEVIVLTRDLPRAQARLPGQATAVAWDLQADGAWTTALDGADAVVNLAGEAVAGGLWTAARKERIRTSRLMATRAIVAALAAANRPQLLINGSAVGYYGDGAERELTETAPAGSDFLAGVVREWEAAAREAEHLGVRVVLIRTGVVLAAQGGALVPIVLPFRFFLGGTMGWPNQWFPWIHIDDEIGLIRLALDNSAASGPINAVGPEPVTMTTFCQSIGQVLGRPSWLPGAPLGMKLLLGEQSQVLLASLKVVPDAARALGYQFIFPTHRLALQAALGKESAPR